MSRPILVTIPFSHYCEKARWALLHTHVDFREEAHLPFVSRQATLRRGRWASVPMLSTSDGPILESSEILRWADERAASGCGLFPEEPESRAEVTALEDRFDAVLGPHTRRLAYSMALPDRSLVFDMAQGVAPVERAALRFLFPVAREMIRRGLRITSESVARSRAKIAGEMAFVAERLHGGRRYLVGDQFSAADLTFAALAAPVLVPEGYGAPLPPVERLPDEGRAEIEQLRASPAGQFALRMYAEHRAPGSLRN